MTDKRKRIDGGQLCVFDTRSTDYTSNDIEIEYPSSSTSSCCLFWNRAQQPGYRRNEILGSFNRDKAITPLLRGSEISVDQNMPLDTIKLTTLYNPSVGLNQYHKISCMQTHFECL